MTQLNLEIKNTLIETALKAKQWAYAPYSRYSVGAALLTVSGKIYDGVNVENAVYSMGICAERTAVFKAVSEGEREFTAIVVATDNGVMPCGPCRQVLAEYGLKTIIIAVDEAGRIHGETSLEQLLPGAFRPEDLI